MLKEQPAVLFENVEGSSMPILGNAFGTIKRLEIALGLKNFSEIGERIVGLTKMKMPTSILDKLRMLPRLSEVELVWSKPCGIRTSRRNC